MPCNTYERFPMITNPQIGQRMRIIDHHTLLNDRVGTIIYLYADIFSVLVRLDNPLHGCDEWVLQAKHIAPLEISPDEQERRRRQEHAMKYF